VIVFPNCKINLGLNILLKRVDGFHDLETIFFPLPLYDILELIPNPGTNQGEELSFSTSGLPIDGAEENNLCTKAYRQLKNDYPLIPSLQMHLHKNIPMGAGLGGGSSDGAFALKMLNEMFSLNLSTPALLNYAAQLGSDGPFFILNRPCFATGRGEILEEIQVDLSAYKFILVNPALHVNTAQAFSGINPSIPGQSIKEIIQQPISTWKDSLKNDFEKVIFAVHPAIADIKDEFYKAGAIYAAMSGSGSTVFGIWEKTEEPKLSFPAHYSVLELPGKL
jgi:4-diphosphocytidyl-2-C-methyl-D-erythritol kinase